MGMEIELQLNIDTASVEEQIKYINWDEISNGLEAAFAKGIDGAIEVGFDALAELITEGIVSFAGDAKAAFELLQEGMAIPDIFAAWFPKIAGFMTQFKALFGNGELFAAIGAKFCGFGQVLMAGLKSIGAAISGAFGSLAAMVGSAGLAGLIIAAVVALVAAIIAIICNWDAVKDFFTVTIPNWWNGTVLPWIQGVPEFFAELPGRIYEKIILLKDKLVEWATGMIETVTTEVSKIIDKILEFFAELPEKLGHALGFAVGRIAAWVYELIMLVTTEVPKIINAVITFFAGLPGKIWNAIILVKDTVIEWANTLWVTLTTKIPEIIANVVNFFRELPGKIWTAIVTTVQKIGDWCATLQRKVIEEIPKIINSIINFFAELPGKIYEIGKNLILGFVNGIKDFVGAAFDAVGDFIGGFIDGFEDGFDIHSPSRVMYQIGKYVVAGFENGISDKWNSVETQLLGLVDQTTSNVGKSLDDMYHINGELNIGTHLSETGVIPGVIGAMGTRSNMQNTDEIEAGLLRTVKQVLQGNNDEGKDLYVTVEVGGEQLVKKVVKDYNKMKRSNPAFGIIV